jgi:hypothetical protein
MLKISDQQNTQILANRFEHWLDVHLRRFFPEIINDLGEEKYLSLRRESLRQSAQLDISLGQSACVFIDLIFTFGPQFYQSPDCIWATDLMDNMLWDDPDDMVDDLYDAAIEHLEILELKEADLVQK